MTEQRETHDTPEKRLARLASMTSVYCVVQNAVESYVPGADDNQMVEIHPDVMDCLCLVALVGLDAIDAERRRRGL